MTDDFFSTPIPEHDAHVVIIGGQRFDFDEIRAMRDAAAVIVELPTCDEREAAIDQIPPGFREQVVILVERAFFHRGQGG